MSSRTSGHTELNSREATRETVRRLVDEALSGGDFGVADALIAPDARFFSNLQAEPLVGPEGFRRYIGGVRAGIPDTRVEIHRLVVEGEDAFAHWTLHGTHTGELHGLPATGRTIALEALEGFRVSTCCASSGSCRRATAYRRP
jgi:steroid delta-isomerase-like uncharacterized protein